MMTDRERYEAADEASAEAWARAADEASAEAWARIARQAARERIVGSVVGLLLVLFVVVGFLMTANDPPCRLTSAQDIVDQWCEPVVTGGPGAS
jgi:hypothetical protein